MMGNRMETSSHSAFHIVNNHVPSAHPHGSHDESAAVNSPTLEADQRVLAKVSGRPPEVSPVSGVN